jgi:hypothetical protein
MKTLILSIFLITTFSVSAQSKKTATINQYDGIDVYFDSRPTVEYEMLGEVKVGVCKPYEGCRDKLVTTAKKSYSQVDAIIIMQIHCSKVAKAEAVKYK